MDSRMLEESVMGAAKQLETAVDSEITRLQNLGDADLEKIRKKRLAEMKALAARKHKWNLAGHGTLRVLEEKEFFEKAKESERIIIIFHKGACTPIAREFMEHCEKIAEHHPETLIAKIDVEKAGFLVHKFAIRIIPSIMFVKDGKVNKVLHGLSAVDNTGVFTTEKIEQVFFDMQALTNTTIGDNEN